LDRRIENELFSACAEKNVAITVFASSFIGLLTGAYRYGQPPPPGTPWAKGPYNYRKAMTRDVDNVIQTVLDVACRLNKTSVQVALAWCLARPQISSVIIGVDTPEQVEEDFGALGWALPDEEFAMLDAVSEGMQTEILKNAPEGYQDEGAWSS